MRSILALALVTFLIAACSSSDTTSDSSTANITVDSAQWVVNQAIARHGGESFEAFTMTFIFRDREYLVKRGKGRFRYERSWTTDTTGTIRDVLDNEGLTRYQDGTPVALPAEDSAKYANSVNSVAYFALLPYGLNDPAVFKSYAGRVTIKGEPYYKVKVTFAEEGGGTDFDDVFYYWVHRNEHTMDFLAYYYHTDGGGSRFRVAINAREPNGLRVQDYVNYTYTGDTVAVADYDRAFEEGRVRELSRILSENVEVKVPPSE